MAASPVDWIARIVAIAGLIISGVNGLVTYRYQQSQLTESLSIQLTPHKYGEVQLTDIKFGPNGPRVVQIPWEVQVSNTGNPKLSMIKYKITASSPLGAEYSGLDGGLRDADNKAVMLPLLLESGETRKFFLRIGVQVTQLVYDAISNNIDKIPNTLYEVEILLARKGVDVYGNKVSIAEYQSAGTVISIDKQNQKSPRFFYNATTGRGNAFTGSASTYNN